MKFPLTRAEIAAAFGGCCGCIKRVVELENAEEKEDEELRDEEVKERLKKKEAENILIISTIGLVVSSGFLNEAERDEIKRIEAENIFNGDDWRELNVGYTRKFYKTDSEGNGMRDGAEVTEFVKMGTARKCSYSTKTDEGYVDGVWIVIAKETRILKVSTEPGAEFNGITPRQLRAIMAMIMRRCVKEKWRDFKGKLLTPDKVTLYDVNRYIILPFTVETQLSFVQSLSSTAGPQPPRFFISHWWGETVRDFLDCIERMIIVFQP